MSTLTRQIGNEIIKMTFHLPDLTDGYYRGTRFDHSGVFKFYQKCEQNASKM